MFDPDDNADYSRQGRELDTLLAKLDDCDLGSWDRDFVDDLIKRMAKSSPMAIASSLTARQWEQLERMKGQYNG